MGLRENEKGFSVVTVLSMIPTYLITIKIDNSWQSNDVQWSLNTLVGQGVSS